MGTRTRRGRKSGGMQGELRHGLEPDAKAGGRRPHHAGKRLTEEGGGGSEAGALRPDAASGLWPVFDNVPVGIALVSLDGRYLEINAAFCGLLGYTRRELLRLRIQDVTLPDDMAAGERLIERALSGELSVFSWEKRYRLKDGGLRWCDVTVQLVRDAGGNPRHFITVADEITRRKDAEGRFEATFEQAAVGIAHNDLDGRFFHVNRKLCEMLGYGAEELIGKTIMELSHPEDRGAHHQAVLDVIAGRAAYFSGERRLVRKDGSVAWVNRTVSLARDASGEEPYLIQVIEDVSERKRAEEAVVRERVLLRAVVDALPERVYVKDRDGRFLLMNAENLRVRGIDSHDEIVGKTVFDVFSREIAEQLNAEDQAVIESGLPLINRERRTSFGFPATTDGEARWHLTSKVPLRDVAGNVVALVGVNRDITERKRAEQALQQSEERFRAAFEQAGVGMALRGVDPRNPRWLRVNQKLCDILGYTREELLQLTSVDVTPPEDRETAIEYNEQLLKGDITGYSREKRYVRKDGQIIWVNISLTAVRSADGAPTHIISIIQDITDRKRAEAALYESEEQFRQLAHNIPQVFWICDASQREMIYVSPAYERVTGRPIEPLMTNPRAWLEGVHEEDRERVKAARRQAGRGRYDEIFRVVRPDGAIRWVRDRAFPVFGTDGEVYRIAGIAEDITELREAEEQLLYLAHYDNLTSLPNRILFYDRLKQALSQARRNNWITAIMFLDLDRFKNVNDTLGHGAGDLLLRHVAERLGGCVRAGDTVGRLSGDEFSIVLSNLSGPDDASLVAQKIMATFEKSFNLYGKEVFVTASIGITLFPMDSVDQEVLIRNADTAMYRAKDLGRNSFRFYTPEMNARALEKLSLESSLRRALEREEFLVHYQPKVSLASGEITGVEALLRWRHPELGLVATADFMPMLEETGLIVPIGEWVLRTACAQIRAWQEAGIQPVPVAVNLSARQFLAKDLGATIARILEEVGIEHGLLELEITEGSLASDTEEAAAALDFLHALGVKVAIDDFGTGYSSLSRLKRFPLDALKIDSSFVRDITTDADDAAITLAIITMAHSLELAVVAEGVETEQQLDFLCANGCDQVQGYYFSAALSSAECTEMLRRGERLRRPARSAPAEERRKAPPSAAG
jgi:diguanylate cyclase (GGDEF)-like protein/PAS domain S-box-containing protein